MTDSAQENRPSSAPFPIRQSARLIDGVHTEVICQAFGDRTLVLVTQTGKVGSLTQINVPLASLEQGYELSPGSADGIVPALPIPLTSLQLTPLLSSTPPEAKPLFDVYLSQIAMLVFSRFNQSSSTDRSLNPEHCQKPVLVGMALIRRSGGNDEAESSVERVRFATVMKMVLECQVW